jgi:hypothetical protein
MEEGLYVWSPCTEVGRWQLVIFVERWSHRPGVPRVQRMLRVMSKAGGWIKLSVLPHCALLSPSPRRLHPSHRWPPPVHTLTDHAPSAPFPVSSSAPCRSTVRLPPRSAQLGHHEPKPLHPGRHRNQVPQLPQHPVHTLPALSKIKKCPSLCPSSFFYYRRQICVSLPLTNSFFCWQEHQFCLLQRTEDWKISFEA